MTATPRKNNEGETRLTLKEIAERLGGELIGDPGILVAGAAGIKEAKKDEITFFSNPRYLPYLEETQAAAVITSKDVQPKNKPVIRVENPSLAFTNVLSLFVPPIPERKPGVHSTAVVDPSVEIGSSVSIGPYVVIEEGCRIGEGSALDAHVYVGRETRLGQGCIIYPNVTIRERCSLGNRVIVHSGTVIGSDGFGYETVKGKHQKIPHYGCVVIEDDVEIGSNVSIDRGRFDKTWIKEGSKIDNLVQIAHNVVVGPHCLIVSQAGISGSTELGRNVVIAGQSGIVGHITLGDEVIVGAGAGVTKSWPEKTILLGGPAKPISEQKKIFALIARLPELFRDMAKLKKNQTN